MLIRMRLNSRTIEENNGSHYDGLIQTYNFLLEELSHSKAGIQMQADYRYSRV